MRIGDLMLRFWFEGVLSGLCLGDLVGERERCLSYGDFEPFF